MTDWSGGQEIAENAPAEGRAGARAFIAEGPDRRAGANLRRVSASQRRPYRPRRGDLRDSLARSAALDRYRKTLQFPYLDVTTVQASGTSPFFGGVILNWTEEAQTRTETEPQFKMLELKAHELSGYAVSSNILLQDASFGL